MFRSIERFYKGDLDKSKYGMVERSHRLANYKGFIFCTMDADGAAAGGLPRADRSHAHRSAGRPRHGDRARRPEVHHRLQLEVRSRQPRWTGITPQVTHMSALLRECSPATPNAAVEIGGATDTLGKELEDSFRCVGDGMDELVLLAEYGHVVGGPTVSGLTPAPRSTRPGAHGPSVVETLGPVGVEVAGHPNLFPNLWIVPLVSQMSLRVPVSPTKTEIWWFSFVPKNATPQERAMNMCARSTTSSGPPALFEQEDGENWAQSTLQIRGRRSQRIPQLLMMDLGRGKVIKEHGLARIEGTTERARPAVDVLLVGAVDEGSRLGRPAQGDSPTGRDVTTRVSSTTC